MAMRRPSREKTEAPVRRIVRTREEIEGVDAKDRASMDKFVTHHGKILPQRITGVSAKQQRKIKRIVKQARSNKVM